MAGRMPGRMKRDLGVLSMGAQRKGASPRNSPNARFVEAEARKAFASGGKVDPAEVARRLQCSEVFVRNTVVFCLRGLMKGRAGNKSPWDFIEGGKPRQGGQK